MLKEIENSNLVFDTELNKIAYRTVTNKLHYRDNFMHKGMLSCYFEQFTKDGRNRRFIYPLLPIICKYGYDIDIKDKVVFLKDNDGGYSTDNIVLRDISEICDEWVIPEELRGEYKLSRNGDVYHIFTYSLRKPPINGTYFKIYGNLIHRLVFKYFSGKELCDDYVVDHIDNNPINNRIDNLQLITQNENVKKERNRLCYGSRYIFHNGKRYFLNSNFKGKYSRSDENKMYENAINIMKQGKLDECYCDNDYIYFNFLTLKWHVHKFPTSKNKNVPIEYRDKEFDTLELAESYFKDICNKFDLVYLKRNEVGSYKFFKTKGEISFKYLGKNYRFNISSSKSPKTNDYALRMFCECSREEFIDLIPKLGEMRIKEIFEANKLIEEEKLRLKKEKLLELKKWRDEKNLKEKEKLKKWEELENLPCYEMKGKHFSIFCYNRGIKYFIGKVFSKDIAIEIDKVIKERDKSLDFKSWLESFKANDFPLLRGNDVEEELMRRREEESNGYDWFKPRNCWRSKIGYNGKTITLGYFKNKICCKMIYKEALNAVSLGLFDKWYEEIKSHRERIKKMCN